MQTSFVQSANDPDGPFPLNNLPYGVCTPANTGNPTVCVAIGDRVLNLSAVCAYAPSVLAGPLLPSKYASTIFSAATLNPFLAQGRAVWVEVRTHLKDALSFSPNNPSLKNANADLHPVLLPQLANVQLHLPLDVGDYTDFYSSISHARNVGTMFRGPENALPISWLHMPIAYHGRSSTIVPSGTPVRRPCAQLAPAPDADAPTQEASRRLDFELEVATVLGGPPNNLGDRLTLSQANERVFGLTLMNDWSARDVQKWEYVPLGPFTSKNLATTISPFIVPLDALEPFRCPPPAQDPAPLPYLTTTENVFTHATFNVELTVSIAPNNSSTPSVVCRTNLSNLYWTIAQQVAHHTVTGCVLRPGDLLGSGTISGDDGKFDESLFCVDKIANDLDLTTTSDCLFINVFLLQKVVLEAC